MKIRVDVTLKAGVLDPQGKAVEQALHTLGFPEVQSARVGKVIELDLSTEDPAAATAAATAMAEKLLANCVIEDYRISA
jgi:phosphoribosylformylglycinamidine synthase subunit PurS